MCAAYLKNRVGRYLYATIPREVKNLSYCRLRIDEVRMRSINVFSMGRCLYFLERILFTTGTITGGGGSWNNPQIRHFSRGVGTGYVQTLPFAHKPSMCIARACPHSGAKSRTLWHGATRFPLGDFRCVIRWSGCLVSTEF